MNQVHQQLVLIGLFQDVLSPLDLQESLILSVDAMDFFLGQLLQIQELHQDLKEQKLVPLVDLVRCRSIKVVFLNDRFEHPHLLQLLLEP